MKTTILILLQIAFLSIAYCQDLKFDHASPIRVSAVKQDKTISIPFSLAKATKDCDITVEIDDVESSALKDTDYTLSATNPIKLTKDNNYSGKIEVVIKQDTSSEKKEIYLNFKYKNENNKEKKASYIIFIAKVNNSNKAEPLYTEDEKNKIKNLSIELYTGGSFDFFESLKFQNIGGELVINLNNIVGKANRFNNRFGGFMGVSNFQNFSFDSSNRNVRVQNIQIDTGAYVNGVTRYIHRTFIDHQKLSTNQWSYYFNPTYRLNEKQSEFFNIYLSFRLEMLRSSTQTEFKTDTVSFADTTNVKLGDSPVFQSGNGFLLQKQLDIQTNEYFSLGFPMTLNAKEIFKLYFDPNIGIATYNYSYYRPSSNRTSLDKITENAYKPFYLFRVRVTEQFSGLNITIGGEVRGLFQTQTPSINLYLGIKANIVKWFKKDNS
jgi:hypothetical protein